MPQSRKQICDELAAAGATTVGFEWNQDVLVEKAHLAWIARGRPKYAVVIIERDPADGSEIILVEAPADDGPIDLE